MDAREPTRGQGHGVSDRNAPEWDAGRRAVPGAWKAVMLEAGRL